MHANFHFQFVSCCYNIQSHQQWSIALRKLIDCFACLSNTSVSLHVHDAWNKYSLHTFREIRNNSRRNNVVLSHETLRWPILLTNVQCRARVPYSTAFIRNFRIFRFGIKGSCPQLNPDTMMIQFGMKKLFTSIAIMIACLMPFPLNRAVISTMANFARIVTCNGTEHFKKSVD
jgi:hypothetical protein